MRLIFSFFPIIIYHIKFNRLAVVRHLFSVYTIILTMNLYEFTFLLHEEAELQNLKKLVESLSGKVVEEQSWGKKDLAYPIKKATNANYYCWKVEMAAKDLPEFKRKLTFNDKLVRHLLLTISKN